MSLFKKLFSRTKPETHLSPMAETATSIVKAIISASYSCYETLNPMLRVASEKENPSAEIYGYFEYIYFFTHIVMRFANAELSSYQFERLKTLVLPVISETAIDTFRWDNLPSDYKPKMVDEFDQHFEKTNQEYLMCAEWLPSQGLSDNSSIFSKVIKNIFDVYGYPPNHALMNIATGIVSNELFKMNIQALISQIKRQEKL